MLFLLLVMLFTSSISKTESQSMIKVDSFHSLISYLVNGADVRYFFNTSSCNRADLVSGPEIPVFGGEINLFVVIPNTDGKTESLMLSQVLYIDENGVDLNEEIHTIWISNNTADIYQGKPGFFENSTADTEGILCNWTTGEGSIWVKPQQQERLETFQEIQVMLTSGEGVRWVVNIKGCKCPPDPPYCGYGFVGDTIKDFKIMKDGSISFSASTTLFVPYSWLYVRLITSGYIFQNNTANLVVTYLNPTTWEVRQTSRILCPITSGSSTEGADFFTSSA